MSGKLKITLLIIAGAPPLGARIRIKNVPFTVIGALKAKGESGWGRSQDDFSVRNFIEAVTLCLIGSFFGVDIGVGTGELIRQTSEIPVLLNIPIIFVAIASATFVGTFFGFYPAKKASRMNPTDALRYE